MVYLINSLKKPLLQCKATNIILITAPLLKITLVLFTFNSSSIKHFKRKIYLFYYNWFVPKSQEIYEKKLRNGYWLMVHCMMFNNSLACWTRLSWCDKKSFQWFFARIKVLSSIRLAYARCSLRALTRLLNIMQWTYQFVTKNIRFSHIFLTFYL